MKFTPSRLARLRAGLSLEAASKRFGVRPATLAGWETHQDVEAWSYRRALEGARHYACSVNQFRRCSEPDEKRAAAVKQRRAA
jgi:hypothetical protein